jgi:hypothetical protein
MSSADSTRSFSSKWTGKSASSTQGLASSQGLVPKLPLESVPIQTNTSGNKEDAAIRSLRVAAGIGDSECIRMLIVSGDCPVDARDAEVRLLALLNPEP